MASSTTMPIASTIANSVDRLIVNPSAAIAANAPMMVTGTVVMGTNMARQSCRNTMITISTRIPAYNRQRHGETRLCLCLVGFGQRWGVVEGTVVGGSG